MTRFGRRLLTAASLSLGLLGATAANLATATPAAAFNVFSEPKYAAIVVDANTGEVLYSRNAEALRHPASLTKIMTLYLTFEALSTGRLTMNDVITVSAHANSMMPSKISTHPGETLTVAQAIPAMTVHSANDVAVAMAERISGSEGQFARLMTLRARELGMTQTSFVNASGLPPDGQQISTARDLAILSRAVMRDYPQYYHFFGLKSFEWHGRELMNHNHLVAKMPGVDGMKTGYTSLAGFNLVASGVRNGHRLVTVVLGGPSVASRDENVEELLDAGFNVLNRRAYGQRMTIAQLVAAPDDMNGPIQRAPIEEGSADQQNLQVEVQPQQRTLPIMSSARALAAASETERTPSHSASSRDAAADCAPAGRSRRSRRAHAACEAKLAKAEKTETAAKTREAKAHEELAEAAPCPTTRKGRHHKAAACATAVAKAEGKKAREETAEAAPCPAPHGRHHRHAACEAAETGTRTARAGAGGDYMIQVGAYKNHALAKTEVDKLAGVVSGQARVDHSDGNYRARFRGLSEKEAKAACRTLSRKGHACMVLASS